MHQKPTLPTLFHHKASGQSAVTVRGPDGRRRTVAKVIEGAAKATAIAERVWKLIL